MDWAISTDKRHQIISSTIDSNSWFSLKDTLSEFLGKVAESLAKDNVSVDWNRIGIEIWLDSGRIIAYPCTEAQDTQGIRIVVQVVIPFVLREYDSLPDPDAEPGRFEESAIALWSRMCSALLSASMREPAKSALSRLRADHPFEVWVQNAGNVLSRRFTSI